MQPSSANHYKPTIFLTQLHEETFQSHEKSGLGPEETR